MEKFKICRWAWMIDRYAWITNVIVTLMQLLLSCRPKWWMSTAMCIYLKLTPWWMIWSRWGVELKASILKSCWKRHLWIMCSTHVLASASPQRRIPCSRKSTHSSMKVLFLVLLLTILVLSSPLYHLWTSCFDVTTCLLHLSKRNAIHYSIPWSSKLLQEIVIVWSSDWLTTRKNMVLMMMIFLWQLVGIWKACNMPYWFTMSLLLGDIVTGGTDTTAVTLAWIIAILVNHPDASKRISEEVDNFISEHKRYPVFSDRSQFPFLNAVQKESMRYRSIGHFVFFHVLDKDSKDDRFDYKWRWLTLWIIVQTHGYLFPKGSWIYPSTYTIHTNSDIYPDADKFVPERFLQDNKTMAAAANAKPGERDHYTFGFGRRVCPGIHLASTCWCCVFLLMLIQMLLGWSGNV